MPWLGSASQRFQCVLKGTFVGHGNSTYHEAQIREPGAVFTALSIDRVGIASLTPGVSLKVSIGKRTQSGYVILQFFEMTAMDTNLDSRLDSVTEVVCEGLFLISDILKQGNLFALKNTPLVAHLPFFVYGSTQQAHLEYALVQCPGLQVIANNILIRANDLKEEDLSRLLSVGMFAVPQELDERLLLSYHDASVFKTFTPGTSFHVALYARPEERHATSSPAASNLAGPIADGIITLGDCVYADATTLNLATPFPMPSSADVQPEHDHPLFHFRSTSGSGGEPIISQQNWQEEWNAMLRD
jgi:hypothetical protein